MVVLYHAQGFVAQYLGGSSFADVFVGGRRGVDLFFVLSGFVIYYIHCKDLDAPTRLRLYAVKRAARIFPNLWLVTLLVIPLFLAGFGSAEQGGALSPYNVAASFLLLPQTAVPILAVSWTLKFEAFFYLMFAIGILRFRVGAVLFVLWQIAALVRLGAGAALPPAIVFYTQPICLEFGVGIGCAMLVRASAGRGLAQNRAVLWALLLVGVGAFLACAANDPADVSPVAGSCLLFALPAGLVITSLVLLERAGSFAPPRWLVELGGASYAIYLVHYSVARAAVFMLQRLHWPVWSAVDLVVVASAGVAAGWVLYVAFDKPTQALLRARLQGGLARLQPSALRPGSTLPARPVRPIG